MDSVKRPGSYSTEISLKGFVGGFANVTCGDDGKRYWIKIKEVSERNGIYVSAHCLDTTKESEIHWTVEEEGSKGIIFNVHGIFMYDRGGDVEMFGKLAIYVDKYLLQTYIPFGRDGKPIAGAKGFENRFYIPGYEAVPLRIVDSFDRILKAEIL